MKPQKEARTKAREEQPEVPQTPYLAARREWNERYGDYVKAAHHWRLAAFGSIAIALASVGGLVAVSIQSKVVPYAVELNGHGEVVQVRRADVLARPDANQIRAALRTWVMGTRTVYTDRLAMKNLIDETYAKTLPSSPAYQNLAEYHRAHNPYLRAANETVSVEVQVAVPVSENSWQVEWTETTRQASGKLISIEQWQATITVAISPPTTPQQIMLNPLGLYVRQFDWTSRLQNR